MILVFFCKKWLLKKLKNIGKRIFISSIDADEFPDLAGKYNARDKPALLLFVNGELIWKQKDILSTEQIIELL